MIDFPRFLSLLAAAALGGCVQQTPRLDSQFGDSVRQAHARQVLQPDAAAREQSRLAARGGIDGGAGVAAFQRYQDSFQSPPAPAQELTIGVSKR
ncbi:hypothetical protein GQ37_019970 [Janthinobacterium sp. BJB1]|uniref:hypothetical protein n=1 Tax=Janthinobacterium sp. GW458P TaxID=1981504 RepID=UPI000A3275C5|nr:hypothetical protein [Janthinobacterium sp. GW458P]MBE3027663.1 hypothetical protein [Janthinobacterium sp. GW458P]PJC96934.1 hypothetical protein GQ37_019970 [Janthinobacterium sp. BJB1]